MMGTLRGWVSNALDRLQLAQGEPLSWAIVAAAVAYWFALGRHRAPQRTGLIAYIGLTLWVIGMVAITTYPFETDFETSYADRLRVESVIPFADTIESISNTRDRVMTDSEYELAVRELAEEMGIPVDEVNLDRVIHGTPVSVALKDIVGNVLLYLPLGLLVGPALGVATWRGALLVAGAFSLCIELSQLVLGVGSLASIDDMIYNVLGAAIGFGLFRLFRAGRNGAASFPASDIDDVIE